VYGYGANGSFGFDVSSFFLVFNIRHEADTRGRVCLHIFHAHRGKFVQSSAAENSQQRQPEGRFPFAPGGCVGTHLSKHRPERGISIFGALFQISLMATAFPCGPQLVHS
jgi:hypothetical protein